ncbi:hypothetical protein [Corallococcus carmarthensis]|uniref:Uncharacterized protein n=1 Tax=Corallococcus carmarthensis TaxID=2316728 RepID=A0A3A8K443_9BACT|nr:hypothetical protein [Corallococcus carmarthensis]RKG98880.1 hypothetical protein D7X32_28215 [Corallococcus carmarthensis]
MSISSLNRASSFQPLSSTTQARPAAVPAQGVVGTPAQQPRNDLRRMLMTDSFEQGPRRMGGASGDFEKQLSEMVGQLAQLAKLLEAPSLGGLDQGAQDCLSAQGAESKVGGVGGAAPVQQAAPAAAAPAAAAPAAAPSAPAAASPSPSAPSSAAPSASTASAAAPAHPTYNSDAGPGFGPPSAGSTEPAPANAPWLAKNNVGSPYNSNMQLIDPGQKDQFKYTNTFTNKTNEPQTITLWNKTGENGNPNDGQNFDKSTPKTFTLQPGQSQVVAFDSNSSVAWCASKDGSAKPGANSGQTWGEATFANSGTGWSGFDTSQISPAGHSGKMSITNEATGKTVTEANAWQTEKDDPALHDVGVPAGPLNLKTELG